MESLIIHGAIEWKKLPDASDKLNLSYEKDERS